MSALPWRRAALFAALPAALLATSPAPASADRFTPVVASVIAPPQPVLASDGRRHLAYELLLTNRSFGPPATATVRRVTARAGGRTVSTLAGRRLASVMFPFGGVKPGVRLAPGESAFVLLDVSFPRTGPIPRRLDHRLSVALRPRSAVMARRYAAAPTRVRRRPAMVVGAPLRGDGWIVGNGCCRALTSHRAGVLPVDGGLYASERFAIDFIQVDAAGRLATGPLERLASYPFYGADVLSTTAGTVVRAVDGRPDAPPGALPPSTADAAAGNHVVVRIGPGRFALYAHLVPGSVRVKVGDRVREGDVLGLLGSSGNSNAPHLHFQLMDGPSPLASNGIPFRFRRFHVAGTLRNFQGLFADERARIAPRLTGEHRDELPLNLQVIGFP